MPYDKNRKTKKSFERTRQPRVKDVQALDYLNKFQNQNSTPILVDQKLTNVGAAAPVIGKLNPVSEMSQNYGKQGYVGSKAFNDMNRGDSPFKQRAMSLGELAGISYNYLGLLPESLWYGTSKQMVNQDFEKNWNYFVSNLKASALRTLEFFSYSFQTQPANTATTPIMMMSYQYQSTLLKVVKEFLDIQTIYAREAQIAKYQWANRVKVVEAYDQLARNKYRARLNTISSNISNHYLDVHELSQYILEHEIVSKETNGYDSPYIVNTMNHQVQFGATAAEDIKAWQYKVGATNIDNAQFAKIYNYISHYGSPKQPINVATIVAAIQNGTISAFLTLLDQKLDELVEVTTQISVFFEDYISVLQTTQMTMNLNLKTGIKPGAMTEVTEETNYKSPIQILQYANNLAQYEALVSYSDKDMTIPVTVHAITGIYHQMTDSMIFHYFVDNASTKWQENVYCTRYYITNAVIFTILPYSGNKLTLTYSTTEGFKYTTTQDKTTEEENALLNQFIRYSGFVVVKTKDKSEIRMNSDILIPDWTVTIDYISDQQQLKFNQFFVIPMAQLTKDTLHAIS